MVGKEYNLHFRWIIYILYSFTHTFSTFYIWFSFTRTVAWVDLLSTPKVVIYYQSYYKILYTKCTWPSFFSLDQKHKAINLWNVKWSLLGHFMKLINIVKSSHCVKCTWICVLLTLFCVSAVLHKWYICITTDKTWLFNHARRGKIATLCTHITVTAWWFRFKGQCYTDS